MPVLLLVVVALAVAATVRQRRIVLRRTLLPELVQLDPSGRLTPEVTLVLNLASIDAGKWGHESVEPIHLLFGLAAATDPVCAALFHRLRLDPETVRWRVKEGLVFGEASPRKPPFSFTAKEAVRLGLAEASRRQSDLAGPAYLLLGLLAEGGHAAEVLASLGVTEARVRAVMETPIDAGDQDPRQDRR